MIYLKKISNYLFLLAYFSLTTVQAAEVQESQGHFLRSAIQNILRERGELNVLDIAKDISINYLRYLESIQQEIGTQNNKSASTKALNYYPISITPGKPHPLLDKAPSPLLISQQLQATREFINVNIVSFRILANSFIYATENNVDLIPLAHECARLLSTCTKDFVDHKDTKAAAFLAGRIKAATNLIAIIISAVDLSRTLNNDKLISAFINSQNDKEIHLKLLLTFLQDKLCSENEGFLYVEKDELENLRRGQYSNVGSDSEVYSIIRSTQLFKILDSQARNIYIKKFDNLKDYNIYLGSIDDFLKAPKSKQKIIQERPARKKVAAQPITEEKSTPGQALADDDEEEDDGLVDLIRDFLCPDAPIEKSRPKKLVPEKSPSLPCDRGTKISFADYIEQRRIETTSCLSYRLDNESFNNENHFAKIAKGTTQQLSSNIQSLYKNTRNYYNSNQPNIASFFIRFHLKNPQGKTSKVFESDKFYLSSNYIFNEGKEAHFKAQYHLKAAFDLLSEKEQKQYYDTTELRSIFLRNLIYNKLSKHVSGPWFDNALDSEALIFLDILDNLRDYLSHIEEGSTIEAIFIGVESLYKSCYRCGNLMQGLQRAMHNNLKAIAPRFKITISESAPIMVLVNGTRVPTQPVKTFMRNNDTEPFIKSENQDPRYQFRLFIKQ
jgi:hypothetical protein